jgi:hypothetical protein
VRWNIHRRDYYRSWHFFCSKHLGKHRILHEFGRYMKDLTLPEDRILEVAKRKVSAKIKPEILEWLQEDLYPEVIQVCKEIFVNGFVSINRFAVITKVESKHIQGRSRNWQEGCLTGNLFQMDDGIVFFQNRATRQFVREYLKYN